MQYAKAEDRMKTDISFPETFTQTSVAPRKSLDLGLNVCDVFTTAYYCHNLLAWLYTVSLMLL